MASARTIIDSLLFEMPLYTPHKPDNDRPRITFDARADTFSGKFTCKSTAYLSSGETKEFWVEVPMTPEQRKACEPLKYEQIKKLFPQQTKETYDKSTGAAREWIKKHDEPHVQTNFPERFEVSAGDVHDILKGFRYTVGTHGPFGGVGSDVVASLANIKKPEDRFVTLLNLEEPKGEGRRSERDLLYFVLLNPEEYDLFKHRVILAKRQEVEQHLE